MVSANFYENGVFSHQATQLWWFFAIYSMQGTQEHDFLLICRSSACQENGYYYGRCRWLSIRIYITSACSTKEKESPKRMTNFELFQGEGVQAHSRHRTRQVLQGRATACSSSPGTAMLAPALVAPPTPSPRSCRQPARSTRGGPLHVVAVNGGPARRQLHI